LEELRHIAISRSLDAHSSEPLNFINTFEWLLYETGLSLQGDQNSNTSGIEEMKLSELIEAAPESVSFYSGATMYGKYTNLKDASTLGIAH
jgi:hypothetical protein